MKIVFGAVIDSDTVIAGVPVGAKVRLRSRADDFTIAYVRTDNAVAAHVLEALDDGATRLGPVLAINHRNVRVSL